MSKLKKVIVPLLRKNGVVRAGIFGSYARGEQKKRSDVDLMVKFRKPRSLLYIAGVELELEEALGKEVDLLTYGAINPLLKNRIMKEEVRIL